MVDQELVGEDGRYLDASLLCLIQMISAIPSITIDHQKADQNPRFVHSHSLCSHIFDDKILTD